MKLFLEKLDQIKKDCLVWIRAQSPYAEAAIWMGIIASCLLFTVGLLILLPYVFLTLFCISAFIFLVVMIGGDIKMNRKYRERDR
jgi:hypothetical protein